jgi:SPP1 gp7 family putative phage head morphogenesis protein
MNQKLANQLLMEKNRDVARKTRQAIIKLVRLYKESYEEIQNKISDYYAKYGDQIANKILDVQRMKKIQGEILTNINRLNKKAQDRIKDTIKIVYEDSYNKTGEAFQRAISTELEFGKLNEAQINRAVFRAPYNIRWTERMAKNHAVYYRQITDGITKGIIQGKSYPNIVKSIKTAAEIGKNKMIRIVNTETHRAAELGTLEAYNEVEKAGREFGLSFRKKWLATDDNRTRDTHRHLDGQLADKDGYFHSGGNITQGPSQFGIAEEDINCRCTTVLEMIEEPNKLTN